jgi:hypothetical protein
MSTMPVMYVVQYFRGYQIGTTPLSIEARKRHREVQRTDGAKRRQLN